MGVSPGGNNVGTLTLVTCRARPSNLKATGQCCQSNSKRARTAQFGGRGFQSAHAAPQILHDHPGRDGACRRQNRTESLVCQQPEGLP